MNLDCKILPTSTRNLRQTKAEMRRELEELRWNMRPGGPNPAAATSAAGGGAGHDSNGAHSTPGSTPFEGHATFQSPRDHISATYSNPSAEQTDASASMSPRMESAADVIPKTGRGGNPPGPTLPRSLDGYAVDAKRINECFALYVLRWVVVVYDGKVSLTNLV
jgi:transcriptional regulatory protein LEU3